MSWNNPYNGRNLLRLILKESYGVVYSGVAISQTLVSRQLLILAYFDYLLADFTIAGVFFIILGFIRLIIKRTRSDIFFFLLFLFSGPILYFYSAFFIQTDMDFAIFEQFLSFSYIFLIYFLSTGLQAFYILLKQLLNKFSPHFLEKSLGQILIYSLFLFFPLILFYVNYPKLSILKNDFTAEELGTDILDSVEETSIVFLGRDTPLFDTQYVYYTQHIKPSIKLFHIERFIMGEYIPQIKKHYPELQLPKDNSNLFSDFIRLNYDSYQIYTVIPLALNIDNTFWIKYGILYRLYKKEDLPSVEYVKNRNMEIMNNFNDPLSGSLAKYQNLYLTNVLDIYEESYLDFSDYLTKAGFLEDGLNYISKAIRLNPNNETSYYRQAEIHIYLKQCQDAINTLEKARSISPKNLRYFQLMTDVYGNCLDDLAKAKKYYETYEQMKKQSEQQLNKL